MYSLIEQSITAQLELLELMLRLGSLLHLCAHLLGASPE